MTTLRVTYEDGHGDKHTVTAEGHSRDAAFDNARKKLADKVDVMYIPPADLRSADIEVLTQ